VDTSVRRKRVAFVIAHLGPGGAQRVAATAANALAERGIEVHVITLLDDHDDAYLLDPPVRRHRRCSLVRRANAGTSEPSGASFKAEPTARPLARIASYPYSLRRPADFAFFAVAIAKRAYWLRQALRTIAPDTVLSFLTQTNILTLLATRGLRVRTVVSERNDPHRQFHHRRVALLRKLVYPWSDLVTANSLGALSALETFVPKEKLAFLPNPLSGQGGSGTVVFASPTFITVTRLVEQKGPDVLLKAAARAFESLPDWRLAIVGEGPLRDELQAQARELGIAPRVDWYGHVGDPMPYLRVAKVFVLTSRFEGSPNALLEAMASGLPSVVSDASPGPLELIGDQAAGLIVPVDDADATAAAMVRLASDEALRAHLGEAARERTIMHRLDHAMRVWLELLDCA
jgi:glycosyltransferase involved in cell wall biosynthesis